jgi:hypothetical protein
MTQATNLLDTNSPEFTPKEPQAPELDPSGDQDQDGVNNGTELVIGTNPYSADTDNDGIKDGEELLNNQHPLIKTREDARSSGYRYLYAKNWDIPPANPENQKFRDQYQQMAQEWLSNKMSWDQLYICINGPNSTGKLAKSLDAAILEQGIKKGIPLEEALCYLAQSPFVQYSLHTNECSEADVVEYFEYQIDRYKAKQVNNEAIENFIANPSAEKADFPDIVL